MHGVCDTTLLLDLFGRVGSGFCVYLKIAGVLVGPGAPRTARAPPGKGNWLRARAVQLRPQSALVALLNYLLCASARFALSAALAASPRGACFEQALLTGTATALLICVRLKARGVCLVLLISANTTTEFWGVVVLEIMIQDPSAKRD
jgi:hypothetical protein